MQRSNLDSGVQVAMIRFFIGGDVEYASARADTYVQISTPNARDLLRWLWFDADAWGALDVKELRARCRRRLWPVERNFDPAIPERVENGLGGQVRLIQLGREAGYLRNRTEELLRLTDRAEQLKEENILFSE